MKKNNLNTTILFKLRMHIIMSSGIINKGEILDKVTTRELPRAPYLIDAQRENTLSVINNECNGSYDRSGRSYTHSYN